MIKQIGMRVTAGDRRIHDLEYIKALKIYGPGWIAWLTWLREHKN